MTARDDLPSAEVPEAWKPTEENLAEDGVSFGVGVHDLRVRHGEWIYYVKVVPARRNFLRATGGDSRTSTSLLSPTGTSEIFGLVLLAVLAVGAALWSVVSWLIRGRPDAQTEEVREAEAARREIEESTRELVGAATHVGVVRIPAPSSWRTDRAAVVEKHLLEAGEPFAGHLMRLASQAAAGAFAPST